MRKQPQRQISLNGLKVWRLQNGIISLIFLFIIIGVFVASYYFQWPYWIGAILIGLWILQVIFGIWLIPKIRHHIWRYEVFENEIEIQHGLIRVTRVIVPMVRVQHVDTSQGPLLRRYRLASVQISTAATVHDIPALELEEADELRDYISRLARMTEDDV
ncbi:MULTISPECIES: PH domain-containing protein [Bacillus]|uniref:PH domain-containing protein n=1 Tax=Bacillus TaxID=1386 RepID=UPI000E2FCD3D|nr:MULTISPECIES: PH domain-containing protein [Bacillus]MCA1019689.1 PH domain-containing protein [Bacillus stratosphericus]MCY7498989.1 PH domain-containing protein [Bacillus altitudinis]MCY7534194.1 PH domain-containing protein [Bacillus altitudinis]MCY7548119.1 PH domain-containing protein [Bacillus altitudinis]MCY7555021.1 PH domain-containing protein [Bacillus altitudinis]